MNLPPSSSDQQGFAGRDAPLRGVDDVPPDADAADAALQAGLGVNAGHDLNLDNIRYFKDNVPHLQEVSIGHALICEALYMGLENVVHMYLHRLK